MGINLATIAGFMSTGLFAVGTLPMLSKAFRTRNLASYSFGNILLSNVGNVIFSIYVFQLPPGPIWFSYVYNLVTTGLMLVWYLRYEGLPHRTWSSGDRDTRRTPASACCSPAA